MEHEDNSPHENHEHSEHYESHEAPHKKKNMTEKLRTNPWIISTFVLGILAIILIIGSLPGMGITGNVISEDEAVELVLDFVESQVGGEVELIGVSSESGLYKITIFFQDSEVPLYVTKDGKNLVQGLLPLSLPEPEEPEPIEGIVKSDVPIVELFVMAYCPYGTQSEKGFIPAIKTLGDNIDAKIRFVYYAMHDKLELDEQLKEYCIQEEQSGKFLDYLECFLEDGDSDRCLVEVGIDKDKLDLCVLKTDSEFKVTEKYNDESTWLNGRFPLFDIHKDLNEAYDIGGSPTLVINGNVVSSGRDPASYLDVICQAFNEAPEECGEELLDTTYSPGFGYEEGQDTGAQC